MSGISSFIASPANGALNFSWTFGTGVTVDTISKISLILNDFGIGDIQQYSVAPVVTDITSGLVVGVTSSYSVTTYQDKPLENGVEYGAALVVTLKDGTSFSKNLASSIKPLSVPLLPVASVIAVESAIRISFTNYKPDGDASTGFTPLTNIYVYLSENKTKAFRLLKFPVSDFGSDLLKVKIIADGDVVDGLPVSIKNGSDYEVSVQTENSQGLSPLTKTVVVTPSDLPGVINTKIALPTVIFDPSSGVLSTTVLFGNTSDQSLLASTGYPILNYKVYRYGVDASDNEINSTKLLISTIVTDASGLSTTPDVSYNFASTNYPFKVVDLLAVAGKRYKYAIAASNKNGEGLENLTNVMQSGIPANAPTLKLTPRTGDILASAVKPVDMGGFESKLSAPDASGNRRQFFRYTWSYLDASSNKIQSARIVSDASSVSSGVSLVNGRTYTVEAEAITMYGVIEFFGAAASATSVPYGAAPAPSQLVLTTADKDGPLNGAIDASWNDVTNKNGSDGAISYSVLVQDGSGVMQVFASKIVGTTYKLTGLENGKSYNVTVRADVYNTEIADNVSGGQTAIQSAIPFRLPSAATNLALTRPTISSLKFSFDACANLTGLGASAAKSKVVIFDLSAGVLGASSEVILPGVGSLSTTYNGITGKSYQFNVYTGVEQGGFTYYNSIPQTISGTAFGKPDVPRNINIVPVDKGMRILWDAPSNLEGTELKGVKIYLNGQPTPYAIVGSTPEYYIVQGLTNGVTYNVQLKSYGSAFGESKDIESDLSTGISITPGNSPSAPSGLLVLPSANQATITWTRDNTLVTPVKGYRIIKDDDFLSQVDITPGTGSSGNWSWTSTTVSFIATGLTNGTSYEFKISSFTSVGVYSADSSKAAVPFAAPSAPASLACTVGNNTINSVWTAPASTAGANLGGNGPLMYKYMIDASYADASANPVTTNIITQLGIKDLSFNLSSTLLLNTRRYIVTVVAYFVGADENQYTSPATTQIVIVNPAPQDVSGLIITAGNNMNTLRWSNPTDASIYARNAIVIYAKVNSGAETQVASLDASATTFSHQSLLNGASYSYRVVSTHTASAQQPAGAVGSAIPFGKAFIVGNPNPNTAGSTKYTLLVNKNGSNLLDWVAIGALPDGSGNIAVPIKTGTVPVDAIYTGLVTPTTDANQVYSLELDMGVSVTAVMAIIENGAGFITKVIPNGSTAFGSV